AFILCNLPNLFGVRMGNRFLQLVSDGLRVRGTVPAIPDFAAHALRIATREGVFRLGKRTDVHPAHGVRLAQNLLRDVQGSNHLLVLCSTGREYSSNVMRLPADLDSISGMLTALTRKVLAHEHILGIISRPGALDSPPWMRVAHAGRELILAEGKFLSEIGADKCCLLAGTAERNIHGQHRG